MIAKVCLVLLFVALAHVTLAAVKSVGCYPPCQNGGYCSIHFGLCDCTSEWTGRDCSISMCRPSCMHGVCRHSGHSSYCDCHPGWTGADCATGIPCSPPCHHGSCVHHGGPYCICHYGWIGHNCSLAICNPPCQNGGNCTSPNKCTCPAYWTGNDCTQRICSPPCLNGGTCTYAGKCSCVTGWFGVNCRSRSSQLSCSSPLRKILPKLFPHCTGASTTPPCRYGNWTQWIFDSYRVKTTKQQCESLYAFRATRFRKALTSSCPKPIELQSKYICQLSKNETFKAMASVLKLGHISTASQSKGGKQYNSTRGKRMATCPEEQDQPNNRICSDVCATPLTEGKRSIRDDFEDSPAGHEEELNTLDPAISVEPFHFIANSKAEYSGHSRNQRQSSSDTRYFVFVLDGSGSIDEEEFNQKKKFLATIARSLCGHIKVAMITYSTEINLEFCFDCYTDRDDLAEAIERAPYLNRGTRTHQAMKCIYERLLGPSLCDVSGIPQLDVITITDGRHNGQCSVLLDDVVAAFGPPNPSNTKLYALGYGNVDPNGVQQLVLQSDPNHIFFSEANEDVTHTLAEYLQENDPDSCIPEEVGTYLPSG